MAVIVTINFYLNITLYSYESENRVIVDLRDPWRRVCVAFRAWHRPHVSSPTLIFARDAEKDPRKRQTRDNVDTRHFSIRARSWRSIDRHADAFDSHNVVIHWNWIHRCLETGATNDTRYAISPTSKHLGDMLVPISRYYYVIAGQMRARIVTSNFLRVFVASISSWLLFQPRRRAPSCVQVTNARARAELYVLFCLLNPQRYASHRDSIPELQSCQVSLGLPTLSRVFSLLLLFFSFFFSLSGSARNSTAKALTFLIANYRKFSSGGINSGNWLSRNLLLNITRQRSEDARPALIDRL